METPDVAEERVLEHLPLSLAVPLDTPPLAVVTKMENIEPTAPDGRDMGTDQRPDDGGAPRSQRVSDAVTFSTPYDESRGDDNSDTEEDVAGHEVRHRLHNGGSALPDDTPAFDIYHGLSLGYTHTCRSHNSAQRINSAQTANSVGWHLATNSFHQHIRLI